MRQVSHDPAAEHLFNLGNAQAQSEVTSFVVNGWSLYQPGELDDLNYHTLVTGFAQSLCEKLPSRSTATPTSTSRLT